MLNLSNSEPSSRESKRRPGFYVEDRYYRDANAQAIARATYLAKIYGRAIPVKLRTHEGLEFTYTVCGDAAQVAESLLTNELV